MKWFRQRCCLCDTVWFLSLKHSITQIRLPAGLRSITSCCCVLAGRKWPGHSRLTVSDWSEEDVSAWLREEGLESLVDTFKANNIDGAELLSLSKESLSSELHIGDATHIHIHTRTRSFTYSKNFTQACVCVVLTCPSFPVKPASRMAC